MTSWSKLENVVKSIWNPVAYNAWNLPSNHYTLYFTTKNSHIAHVFIALLMYIPSFDQSEITNRSTIYRTDLCMQTWVQTLSEDMFASEVAKDWTEALRIHLMTIESCVEHKGVCPWCVWWCPGSQCGWSMEGSLESGILVGRLSHQSALLSLSPNLLLMVSRFPSSILPCLPPPSPPPPP